MNCLICKNLERVVECRSSGYFEARASAYYRVSTELAAHKKVDMERAKSDLEEHRLVCIAAKVRPSGTMASGVDSMLGRRAAVA